MHSPTRFTHHLRDSKGDPLTGELLHELLQVSVTHIDPLPVGRGRPVHVPYDVPWEAHLLDPSNPLVDIGNNGLEKMTVDRNDLA